MSEATYEQEIKIKIEIEKINKDKGPSIEEIDAYLLGDLDQEILDHLNHYHAEDDVEETGTTLYGLDCGHVKFM